MASNPLGHYYYTKYTQGQWLEACTTHNTKTYVIGRYVNDYPDGTTLLDVPKYGYVYVLNYNIKGVVPDHQVLKHLICNA